MYGARIIDRRRVKHLMQMLGYYIDLIINNMLTNMECIQHRHFNYILHNINQVIQSILYGFFLNLI